jgi:hypothetical protein
MARTKILEFPFSEGQHEEIDARMLPDGYLSHVKNLRLRKDGRWGVRPDFDAIGRHTVSLGNNLDASDLIGSDGRLVTIGDESNVTAPPATVYDFVDAATAPWHRLPESSVAQRLGLVTAVRDVGRPSSQAGTATNVDVAAAGGLACMIYHSVSSTYVHVFEPATDQTLFFGSISTSLTKAYVLAVGTVFWIVGATGSSVDLWRFDPASDTAPAAGNNVSSGAGITALDASVNNAGNGLWVVVHRNATPSTQIYPVSSAGVVGTVITGPATAFDFVSVAETSNRLVLGVVNTAGATVSAYSYSSGVLSAGPTTVFGASTTTHQVGLLPVVANVYFYAVVDDGTTLNTTFRTVNGVSHALGTQSTVKDAPATTKPFTVPATVGDQDALQAVGIFHDEDGTFKSNALLMTSAQILGAYKDKFSAIGFVGTILPRVAYDSSTGKYYWPMLVDNGDGAAVPVVSEFAYGSSARRQSADLAGLTYIAGGAVQIYDGRELFDAGFAEQPRVVSATPSNGAGALPSNTSLLVALVWEWRDSEGRLHQSAPSEVVTVVMGATDDTITVVASAPHSLRRNDSISATGSTVLVVAYRSISGINQLRRAETQLVASFGSPVTITLLAGDTTVRANGVIYTQAARGEFSGTSPDEAPLPAEYIWPFGARLLTAGGPNPYQAQVSKEVGPGEPVRWNDAIGFFLPAIPERIKGVAALDQRGLLFTSESIFQFAGDGPDDFGAGTYSEPLRLPASTGLRDWRSLLETPVGLFFQGGNGGIWLVPRDGSPPVWIGQPVRDTIDAYPVVTSATLLVDTQLASFTCNNALGTDARVLSYDLRAKTWIVDEFASATPIAAATHYQGRLVYASAGVVYRERTSSTPGAFIEHGLTTGDLKSAGGTGWFKFCRHDLIGEYRGDTNLRARLSYDGGKTFTAQTKIFQLRSTDYAVGDLVRVSWDPPRRKCERVRIEYTAQTAGSATEGFIFNGFAVEVMGAQGASRQAAAQRG